MIQQSVQPSGADIHTTRKAWEIVLQLELCGLHYPAIIIAFDIQYKHPLDHL